MSKIRQMTSILTLTLLGVLVFATVCMAAPSISVLVNGTAVDFPDQKPFINADSRTMVPVRAPMEAIGCTVDWDDVNKIAIITKGDTTAIFTIGSKDYMVNGQRMTMDTLPEIVNSRTVFPIRFCAEAFGAEVGWDQATYTVTITIEKQTVIDPEKPLVMDIPRSTISSQVDKITVADYNIIVTNSGVNYANTWCVIADQGNYKPKPIKVVCISHPELNEHNTLFINGKRKLVDKTQWSSQGYTVFKDNYSKNPKSGDTLTFDVYGKIKGEEVKLVIINKVLP